jgi:hypothetical protein
MEDGMLKFRVMLVALAATVFAVGQAGVARALDCVDSAPGGGSKAILSGTYTMNFLGGLALVDGDFPTAGSGSVTVDGKGDVTGGVIRCNTEGLEVTSPITGGCYTVNRDGTAFMTISTSSSVCVSAGLDGVDLQLAISFAGNQFQFSSDGSDANFDTGANIPFAGTANRLTPSLNVP